MEVWRVSYFKLEVDLILDLLWRANLLWYGMRVEVDLPCLFATSPPSNMIFCFCNTVPPLPGSESMELFDQPLQFERFSAFTHRPCCWACVIALPWRSAGVSYCRRFLFCFFLQELLEAKCVTKQKCGLMILNLTSWLISWFYIIHERMTGEFQRMIVLFRQKLRWNLRKGSQAQFGPGQFEPDFERFPLFKPKWYRRFMFSLETRFVGEWEFRWEWCKRCNHMHQTRFVASVYPYINLVIIF